MVLRLRGVRGRFWWMHSYQSEWTFTQTMEGLLRINVVPATLQTPGHVARIISRVVNGEGEGVEMHRGKEGGMDCWADRRILHTFSSAEVNQSLLFLTLSDLVAIVGGEIPLNNPEDYS